MEGQAQCAWWAAAVQSELPGNLCSRCHLANPLVLLCPGIALWMAQQTNHFIMAYPQAPTEVPLYMKMPSGYSKESLPKGPD